MIHDLEIESGGEKLRLNNYRSIFWSARQMLILADLHIGKPAHFRRHGIALPQQIIFSDLERLTELINHYTPSQIVVSGDLIHAGKNSETEIFTQWLIKYPDVSWTIVKGNHDRVLHTLFTSKSFTVADYLDVPPFRFVHQPEEGDQVAISGHIHPGIRLKGFNHQGLKLPCFLVSPKQIILPAFSLFTGLDIDYVKTHPEFSSVYVVSDNGIIQV